MERRHRRHFRLFHRRKHVNGHPGTAGGGVRAAGPGIDLARPLDAGRPVRGDDTGAAGGRPSGSARPRLCRPEPGAARHAGRHLCAAADLVGADGEHRPRAAARSGRSLARHRRGDDRGPGARPEADAGAVRPRAGAGAEHRQRRRRRHLHRPVQPAVRADRSCQPGQRAADRRQAGSVPRPRRRLCPGPAELQRRSRRRLPADVEATRSEPAKSAVLRHDDRLHRGRCAGLRLRRAEQRYRHDLSKRVRHGGGRGGAGAPDRSRRLWREPLQRVERRRGHRHRDHQGPVRDDRRPHRFRGRQGADHALPVLRKAGAHDHDLPPKRRLGPALRQRLGRGHRRQVRFPERGVPPKPGQSGGGCRCLQRAQRARVRDRDRRRLHLSPRAVRCRYRARSPGQGDPGRRRFGADRYRREPGDPGSGARPHRLCADRPGRVGIRAAAAKAHAGSSRSCAAVSAGRVDHQQLFLHCPGGRNGKCAGDKFALRVGRNRHGDRGSFSAGIGRGIARRPGPAARRRLGLGQARQWLRRAGRSAGQFPGAAGAAQNRSGQLAFRRHCRCIAARQPGEFLRLAAGHRHPAAAVRAADRQGS